MAHQEDLHERYRIRERFETSEIVTKLQPYGDISCDDKEKCYKFVPKDPDWPEAFIFADGRIYVNSEKHFAEEIESFVRNLTDILGMEIIEL